MTQITNVTKKPVSALPIPMPAAAPAERRLEWLEVSAIGVETAKMVGLGLKVVAEGVLVTVVNIVITLVDTDLSCGLTGPPTEDVEVLDPISAPMKTTSTAAYAAVAAKTSCLRAFVNMASINAKAPTKPANAPSCALGFVMKNNARTAPNKNAAESTTLMTDTAMSTFWCRTRSPCGDYESINSMSL
jgi:hypothetical protein